MAYIGQSPKAKRLRLTPQSASPSNPTEGDVFYSDGTDLGEGVYVYKNSAWQEIGSAQGGINYIDDPIFEVGIDFWDGNESDDTKFDAEAETSAPLRGLRSLKFSKKAGGDYSGEYIESDIFTLDLTDQHSVLEFKADITTSSLFSSGDAKWTLIDVENTLEMEFPDGDIEAQENGSFFYTIQSKAFGGGGSEGQYKLRCTVVDTVDQAWDIILDNMLFGPVETHPSAVAVSDWIPYDVTISASGSNPTKATTTVNDQGYYRRVGDSMEIKYHYSHSNNSGASAGSGTYNFSIPSGFTIDTSKIPPNTGGVNVVGAAAATSSTTGTQAGYASLANSSAFFLFTDSDGGDANPVSATWHDLAESSVQYSITAKVPIQGWSSNSQDVASVDDGRQVTAVYRGNSGQALSSGVTTVFDFNTEVVDTHNSVTTGASWQFECPVAGNYQLSGTVYYSNWDVTSGDDFSTGFFVNGTYTVRIGYMEAESTQTTFQLIHSGSGIVYLEKGDLVDLRVFSNAADTFSTTENNHQISITRLAGLNQIVADETIAVLAQDSSGESFTDGVKVVIDYDTVLTDTHGAYSGGDFTAPITGYYHISALLYPDGTGYVSGDDVEIIILKNGSDYSKFRDQYETAAGTNTDKSVSIDCVVQCDKGETLAIAFRSVGFSGVLLNNNTFNTLSIIKVGQ